MNPITKQPWTAADFARWGVRGLDAFTPEELALLQQKLEGWIRQRAPKAGSVRRKPQFFRKPRTAAPA